MLKRLISVVLLSASISAGQEHAPLPPLIPWDGRSRTLAASPGDPWVTPSEATRFRTTPSYDETVAWLRKLVAASPDLRMVSLGKSAAGRDIWMVIATRDRMFTPDALFRTGKPIVLAQGGIHAGEIDGKDAGLMLLRDMTVGQHGRPLPNVRALLERAHFLFVPIYNVDGHERASRFGRINQRGPEVMGWRTTAQNLNLNRDYAKLDAPETRAMVAAINRWRPDLYIDLHVTDGADYQYDITWGWNTTTGYSPEIVRWLDSRLTSAVVNDLRSWGHVPGPLVFPVGGDDVSKGISAGNAQARLSNGYGDVRHLASVLVENHSLKPYDQRVLGTRVLLQSILEAVGRDGVGLKRASANDEQLRIDPVPLDWRSSRVPQETIDLLAVESRTTISPVSGTERTEWLGRPVTTRVPVFRDTEVSVSVPRAKAYWIPPQWSGIADLLAMHGVGVTRMAAPRTVDVDMYRLVDPKLATEAFEGHVMLADFKTTIEKRTQTYPPGSFRVSTEQPLGELITVLLEPASPDSFLRWGFFHEILQRTEYVENYVLEPLAERMLASDPKLAEEFRRKLEEDEAFRASPERRLRFFYERTPYFDDQWLLYPIARER